jgi:uncharacterized protein (DUF1800 family)
MGQTGAARLYMQGTFGAAPVDITTAAAQSYSAWFTAQAAIPTSLMRPLLPTMNSPNYFAWWYNAIKGPDQLRQRVAFALSEIFVVSEINSELANSGQGLAAYYDLLSTNALGNFRTLIDGISHNLQMGLYLSFYENDKPNALTGVHADENYARELMQLFTIGLWNLNPDGTRQLDANGNPIPTYTQSDVTNLANVFTGWASAPTRGLTGDALFALAWTDADSFDPMSCVSDHHDTDAKTIVGGVVIPAGGTCQSDMEAALDTLFNHPNVGPFIGKQLIERLVESNPSPAYVSRVAAVFANNGNGVRGDLLATVEAILTDPEATTPGTSPGSGKLREPVLRLTNLWRAFSASDSSGNIAAQITGNATQDFAENALYSPTVFNFFRPDYERAGPLANAGLVTPEFQITNEYTAVQTNNDLEWQAYEFMNSAGQTQIGMDYVNGQAAAAATDVVLHTAAWEPLAANATTLVNELNLVFMAGQMPTAMQQTLINYVNSIPATSAANRVIEAAGLVIDSPQYAVQR